VKTMRTQSRPLISVSKRSRAFLPALALLAGFLAFFSARAALDAEILSPAWQDDGREQGAEFGFAVAGNGDVNGDGFADILIGAPHATLVNYRAGAAYLYYGGRGGLAQAPTWASGGRQSGESFGGAVAVAGDLNGDGYDDLAVGAYRYKNDVSTPDAGAVFVFYGSPGGPLSGAGWLQESNQKNAQFGYAVSGAGDINGDGYDDLLVGARWYDTDWTNTGAAYLYYGGAGGLEAEPAWSFVGEEAGASLGSAVAGGFDANGDGYSDVLVGAPFVDQGQEDEGAVFLFFGSPQGLAAVPDWTAYGNLNFARLGSSVSGIGDVNGDGYDDLAAGAPNAPNPAGGTGLGLVFFGSPTGPGLYPDWSGGLPQSGSGYGQSIKSAGDVNCDGLDDMVIGANLFTNDQAAEGALFIYAGNPSGLGTIPIWMAEGNKAETQFGFATGSAGDINLDGCDDLIAGAPDYRIGTDPVGRAFVFMGKAEGKPSFHLHLALVQVREP
jgi:hypothetical protein